MSLDPNNQTPIRRCPHGVSLGRLCDDCSPAPGRIEPTANDMGKLWIVRESGGGQADLNRERSERQWLWLRRAINAGWLTQSGALTTEGRHLAAEYEAMDDA